jgi:hypothetical protein
MIGLLGAGNVGSLKLDTEGGYIINQSGKNYKVHEFNSTGSVRFFGSGLVEYLIVGGGGQGGFRDDGASGGGAGGGGFRTSVPGATSGRQSAAEPRLRVGPGSYPAEVGAGGIGTLAPGNPSSFGEIVALGGGNGGRARPSGYLSNTNGGDGGCGGGQGATQNNALKRGGFGTAGQGGDGAGNPNSTAAFAGGGARTSASSNTAGAGESSSITGTSVTYSVGGRASQGVGGSQPANTGNGGNGTSTSGTAQYGGSGKVVVRYEVI